MGGKPQIRPRDPYRYGYIVYLRQRVMEIYDIFEPTTIFIPNKNRGSYEKIAKIILKEIGEDLGHAVLTDFFTKEPLEDGNTNQMISYEKKTVECMAKLVKKFFPNDEPQIQMNSNSNIEKTLKELVYELYLRTKLKTSVNMTTTIHESGLANIESDVYIEAITDVYCYRINLFAPHSIKVTHIEAYETTTKSSLSIIPYKITEKSYYSFILFPKPIPQSSTHYHTLKVSIEDFFIELVKKKYYIEERMIHPDKIKKIIETFRFPDIDFFKGLKIVILDHLPNVLQKSTEILPIIKDGYKVYKIDYGDINRTNDVIRIEMRID